MNAVTLIRLMDSHSIRPFPSFADAVSIPKRWAVSSLNGRAVSSLNDGPYLPSTVGCAASSKTIGPNVPTLHTVIPLPRTNTDCSIDGIPSYCLKATARFWEVVPCQETSSNVQPRNIFTHTSKLVFFTLNSYCKKK